MRVHGPLEILCVALGVLSACGDSERSGHAPDDASALKQTLTAEAPSSHYVVVTLGMPLGAAGSLPSSYLIRDRSGALLEVTDAFVGASGTQVTLATATQQPTEYQLFLANDLGIGSAGFVGSSEREPFLESALALSDTTVELTFSERMDRQLAEIAAFYRLVDPDTDQDVDIEILSADLQDDLRRVILTTTPQQNRLYAVQATNVKSRFACADGDLSELSAGNATLACAPTLRPLTTEGAEARLELTARTGVTKSAPLDPNASGTAGTVKPATSGIGVGSSSCTGNPCAASNGATTAEELTMHFDVPTRADTVVLGIYGLGGADFNLFVSSAASSGFDFTIPSAQLKAEAVGDGSAIYFDQLGALPVDLMIDQVRVRTTAGAACFTSICVSDGRTVDPTRNLANFWGIPTFDDTPPELVEAISTSPTTVLVTFDEPLDSEAADPTHYRVGPDLAVTAAVQTEYQTQVLLTTTLQSAGTEYTLDVSGLRDRARNELAPTSTTFLGISSALFLETAIALSATEVKLTFSEPTDPATSENVANYSITDPDTDVDVDITILGAVASADGRSVVLTTTPQKNILYQVVATNIRGTGGEFFIDPSRNSAIFQGIPEDDDEPPRVVSAVSVNDESVLVTFSEPLRIESANAANFQISPDLNVIDAALTAQEDQILLTTSAQLADVLYTVTVSNVQDKAGNELAGPPDDSASFSFDGSPETANGSHAPRVVGAASTSNTTVVVTFTKAMSDDAISAGNYAIVQQNVNTEVGYLGVVSAQFLGDDGTAVELTTRSQNEVTYMVAVTNVRDRSGNQLAAKEVSAGVLVDPRTATFAGSPWSCGPKLCDNGSDGVGGGYCGSDDDCTGDGACDPLDSPACLESCQVACTAPDPDGDGLTDSTEQRGWVIAVTRTDGTIVMREVTSNPDVDDTDGDGLGDALERLIGSDPRDADTDDDTLGDYDEYNVIYSNTNAQDTDGDGLDDMLEVEFYKTNALVGDSDGDGFTDGDELFSIHRDPRIADLPGHAISVGSVSLKLDQRFSYTDAEGNVRSRTDSTASSLDNATSSSSSNLSQTVGHWLLGADIGIDSCQTDDACVTLLTDWNDWGSTFIDRFHANVKVEGGQEFTTANTTASERAMTQAYAQGIENGLELSGSSQVSREVVGASMLVDLSFQNTSDVAITLESLEVRASTTDPSDPTRMVSVATLLPESTLITGEGLRLHLGPGQTLGPIVFASRDVFPSVVEDLMRAPRGIVFNVANYDLVTADGRNFADGLQSVSERTVGIRIDKGDGEATALHVITAGVLDRPRADLRCANTGSNPGRLCQSDADCGDSAPCEGGKVVGGFSQFAGTGGETPLPLDFVLQDSLGMRRSTPPKILAGGATAGTTANPLSDDVQVIPAGTPVSPQQVVVAPGRDGILQTPPAGTDYASEGMRLLAGGNGAADSAASGDDLQLVPSGTFPLAPGAVVIAAGPNGVLETSPAGDDEVVGPDGIRPGPDGAVQSVARGDDVQLIPLGTTGVPEDAVAIYAGANGVLESKPAVGDVLDVVSGYEVSRTCSGDTPQRILAGHDGEADTTAEDGVCVVAYAPHYPGEECTDDAGCGRDGASGPFGDCRSDVQVAPVDTVGLSQHAVVVQPDGVLDPMGFSFLESVPADDDVFVGPGIPCTVNADCTVDGVVGTCDGPEQVVRVEERRRGQYRRRWALLMSDGTQLETDFGAISVRPGDTISLAFVQDIDRDGLLAPEEFLHGSSDFRPDTDDDQLGDFSEIRIGWEVGVVGESLHRTYPDPRRADSDADGLSDKEEQDLRITQCACGAIGPKSLRGSGNLLRGAGGTDSPMPCTGDLMCAGGLSCRDAVDCTEGGGLCPSCPTDVTLFRTDARMRDTDSDRVHDSEEVFGYLTGPGIVDPDGTSSAKVLVLAGTDLDADTLACPDNSCIEEPGKHCLTDADCVSHVCVHDLPCDDVQVLPVGTGVRDPRTVVAIVGTGTPAASGDVLATSTGAIAQSTLAGDDLLVVGLGESVENASSPGECEDGGDFLFCSAIKPGADGVISSVIGGDDALVPGGFGQRRETSDPLNPDTDMDLVADGYERLLGSSPNKPGDAAFGGDIDEDGLTDSLERAGWFVTVDGVVSAERRQSNALLPDSDFDGLPDYAERYLSCSDGSPGPCPTNPSSADTDGDGISDLDELSTDQLEALAVFGELFPGFVLDASDSAALGTDPVKTDADGDGLTDYSELSVGWQVLRADGTVEHVFSDPSNPDSDLDGLGDELEFAAKTDPLDPDTDGDGRTDGQELKIGSNPLRPDLGVTVTYSAIELRPPSGEDPMEWKWGFFVQLPGGDFPGVEVSDQFDCPNYDSCYCITEEPIRTLPLNKSFSLDLGPGEALVLSGMVRETTENHSTACPGGDTSVYNSDHNGDRYMSFIDQPISYEQLQGGQFLSRSLSMASTDDDSGTAATVLVEISVNCAGSGRGICRTGSLCVDDDDCEAGHCDPDPADPTKKRCADYCGNAVTDAGEACDDGNVAECGTCNASCSATLTSPQCAGGTTCKGNADCASGSCITIPFTSTTICTAACGNGWVEGSELCDDGNTLACGSCNASCSLPNLSVTGCSVGTGCMQAADCASGSCEDRECVAVCGNGLTESGEACDDGNTLACGTCDAACTSLNGVVTGCPLTTPCVADADCASANCNAGVCAP